jgi:sigma-B regulation protein RsbU (phosphoserine phosphatase)
MEADKNNHREFLLEEVKRLRQQVAEADELRGRLKEAQNTCRELENRLKEAARNYDRECREKTETFEALRLAEVIIDNSPVILFRRLSGEDAKLVYVSSNISQFGYSAEEFLSGKSGFRQISHPDDHERVHAEITAYMEAGVEEYEQLYRVITRNGDVRWVEDRTTVEHDEQTGISYNQGILIDITEKKMAEDKLRESEEKHRRIVETAGEGFLLMDKNLKIVDVNEAYCRMIGYSRDEMMGKRPSEIATEEFGEYVQAHTEELLASDYRKFEGTIIAKDGRHIPILIHGNTLRDDSGAIIGNMAFVTDMTEHKKALALAGEVQKSLLPRSGIQAEGIQVAGKNISCDEIGGDYFDFIWQRKIQEGPLSVVVGDITGHGVDSALLMTTARAFLRMRASQPGTIAEIVAAMNRHLSDDVLETGKFMTLFYLTIDSGKNCIEWVRAGHEPAMIYDPANDRFDELKGSGLALGVDRDYAFSVNRLDKLKQHQIIAVGTDGIWEARDKRGEMFGKHRFKNIIRQHAHRSAEDILNAVFEGLTTYTRGIPMEDDITLVVIKVTGRGKDKDSRIVS